METYIEIRKGMKGKSYFSANKFINLLYSSPPNAIYLIDLSLDNYSELSYIYSSFNLNLRYIFLAYFYFFLSGPFLAELC